MQFADNDNYPELCEKHLMPFLLRAQCSVGNLIEKVAQKGWRSGGKRKRVSDLVPFLMSTGTERKLSLLFINTPYCLSNKI